MFYYKSSNRYTIQHLWQTVLKKLRFLSFSETFTSALKIVIFFVYALVYTSLLLPSTKRLISILRNMRNNNRSLTYFLRLSSLLHWQKRFHIFYPFKCLLKNSTFLNLISFFQKKKKKNYTVISGCYISNLERFGYEELIKFLHFYFMSIKKIHTKI